MPAFKREETIGRPEKLVTREQRRYSAIRDKTIQNYIVRIALTKDLF